MGNEHAPNPQTAVRPAAPQLFDDKEEQGAEHDEGPTDDVFKDVAAQVPRKAKDKKAPPLKPSLADSSSDERRKQSLTMSAADAAVLNTKLLIAAKHLRTALQEPAKLKAAIKAAQLQALVPEVNKYVTRAPIEEGLFQLNGAAAALERAHFTSKETHPDARAAYDVVGTMLTHFSINQADLPRQEDAVTKQSSEKFDVALITAHLEAAISHAVLLRRSAKQGPDADLERSVDACLQHMSGVQAAPVAPFKKYRKKIEALIADLKLELRSLMGPKFPRITAVSASSALLERVTELETKLGFVNR